LALTIYNIENNIPFVQEMEKDHCAMWVELFKTHAWATRFLHHIIPQLRKERSTPTDVDHE